MKWFFRKPTSTAPETQPSLGAPVRCKRSIRETRLNEAQARDLFALTQMPGYQVLLDVMEMACVQQETRLINVAAEDEMTVLAEHKMAKARWEFFVWVQKLVNFEVTEALTPKPVPVDPETAELRNILDPLNR